MSSIASSGVVTEPACNKRETKVDDALKRRRTAITALNLNDSRAFGVPSMKHLLLAWGAAFCVAWSLTLVTVGYTVQHTESPHWLAHWNTLTAFIVSLIIDLFGYFYTLHAAKRNLQAILISINVIAVFSYGTIVAGIVPVFQDYVGRKLYVTRYLEWAFTTPVLILLIGILAGREIYNLLKVMVFDVLMVVTGLMASLSHSNTHFALFGFLSVAFWVPVIRTLSRMHEEAVSRALHPDDEASLQFLWVVSIAIWTAFPLIWASSMLGAISPEFSESATCLCDIGAKFVYLLLLSSHNFLNVERTDIFFLLEAEEVHTDLKLTRKRLAQASRMMAEATNDVATGERQSTEFFKTISHELLSPLNAIINFNERLLESNELSADDSTNAFLALTAAKGLLVTVDNLLDYNTLQSSGITWVEAPFDFEELMEGVVGSLAFLASSKRVRLVLNLSSDLPSMIVGDKHHVRKVITNLVHNAIKFTESPKSSTPALYPGAWGAAGAWGVASARAAESVVRIAVTVVARSRGRSLIGKNNNLTLQVVVADQGIGIAAHRLKDWCAPFCPLTPPRETPRYGGPGVGLAIVKRLLDHVGGAVGVDSTLGAGTCVTARVPLQLAHSGECRREQRMGSLVGTTVVSLLDGLDKDQVYPLLAAWGATTAHHEVSGDDAASGAGREGAGVKFTSACDAVTVAVASLDVLAAACGGSSDWAETAAITNAMAATVETITGRGTPLLLLGPHDIRDAMAVALALAAKKIYPATASIMCTMLDNSPLIESKFYDAVRAALQMAAELRKSKHEAEKQAASGARGAVEATAVPAGAAAKPQTAFAKLTVNSATAVAATTAEAVKLEPASEESVRVLITDDNLMSRKVAGALFKRMDGKPTPMILDYAEDGRQCVEKCKVTAYDLVLMDVLMPVCDGLQATRELRALAKKGLLAPKPDREGFIIIGCSANSQDADIKECLKAGMDDFIAKPVRFPEFESLVKSSIRKLDANRDM